MRDGTRVCVCVFWSRLSTSHTTHQRSLTTSCALLCWAQNAGVRCTHKTQRTGAGADVLGAAAASPPAALVACTTVERAVSGSGAFLFCVVVVEQREARGSVLSGGARLAGGERHGTASQAPLP